MKSVKGALRMISSLFVAHSRAADKVQHGEDEDVEDDEDAYMKMIDIISSNKVATQDGQQGGNVVSFGRNNMQLGYVPSDSISVRPVPKRVDIPISLSSNNIVSVAAAVHHTIALDSFGRVWSWGHGKNGRLGLGDETTRLLPTLVSELKGHRVMQASVGRDHSLVVTKAGLIFAWGSNAFGQLGLRKGYSGTMTTHPRKVKLPRIESTNMAPRAKQVGASSTHSVALGVDGSVYTWGANDKGQLGFRDVSSVQKAPELVPTLSNRVEDQVTQLCASDGVTYALTRRGSVFHIGNGSHSPFKVTFTQQDGGVKDDSEFEFGSKYKYVKIESIACGPKHAAAISRDGKLYTWGTYANLLGHVNKGCDRGTQSHTTKPICVEELMSCRITQVSCAKEHTCAIDSNGRLFTWGIGNAGTLGNTRLGSNRYETYQPVPSLVPSLRNIVCVSAADAHTVAVSGHSKPTFVPVTVHEFSQHRYGLDRDDTRDREVQTKTTLDRDNEDEESVISSSDYEDQGSNTYQVKSLQEQCAESLSKSVNTWNVLSIWDFAQHYCVSSLELFCQRFVALNLDAVLVNQAGCEFFLGDLCGAQEGEVDTLCSMYLRSRVGATVAAFGVDSCVDSVKSTIAVERDRKLATEIPTTPPRKSPESKRVASKADLSSYSKISTSRLRRRIKSLECQLEMLESSKLKLMTTGAEHGSNHKRKRSKSLSEQAMTLENEIELLNIELSSRYEKPVAEEKVENNQLHCSICEVTVHDQEGMVAHVTGKRHRKNQAKLAQQRTAPAVASKESVDFAPTRGWSSIAGLSNRKKSPPWQGMSSPPRVSGTATQPIQCSGGKSSRPPQTEISSPMSTPDKIASGRERCLSEFMRKSTKKKLYKAPWSSERVESDKENTKLNAALRPLNMIQQEQLSEKRHYNRSEVETINSWGLCKLSTEQTLAEIQKQQELEMASEKLARQLALEEQGLQESILRNVKKKKPRKKIQAKARKPPKGVTNKSGKSTHKEKDGARKKNTRSTRV
mmetsp:Transcript_1928/g.3411  ORF Transcript_1928/g.3411 Transcript_1928/m.3411 type:complete len:1017 (+) Transcript_1928:469-3519(+)